MTVPRLGLTLGKYAPLHKGHQLVIETALSEMDHVIVMIYGAPETTRCPLSVRAQWIRDLYPTVELVEAQDGPTLVGDAPEIRRLNEVYILRRVGGRGITHFYSSEFYGDHVSRALGAENRLVDPDRRIVPVSGTRIRTSLFLNRCFLDPRVYRDLITNVVFVGAPCTGKTTLAATLADRHDTVWMPEYGREYWEKHQVNRRLTPEELLAIAVGHLEREARLLCEADRYLFTDTNAVTTYMFALYYHGKALPRLTELADAASSRYDLVFLCDTDIPYDPTSDRSGDVNRQWFQDQIVEDLVRRKIPFTTLQGTVEERVRVVSETLARFSKY